MPAMTGCLACAVWRAECSHSLMQGLCCAYVVRMLCCPCVQCRSSSQVRRLLWLHQARATRIGLRPAWSVCRSGLTVSWTTSRTKAVVAAAWVSACVVLGGWGAVIQGKKGVVCGTIQTHASLHICNVCHHAGASSSVLVFVAGVQESKTRSQTAALSGCGGLTNGRGC